MPDREWIVRGEGGSPRFRDGMGKKWWPGDTITEADLLSIYQPSQIEVLIEAGALESPGREVVPPTLGANDGGAVYYCDRCGHDHLMTSGIGIAHAPAASNA